MPKRTPHETIQRDYREYLCPCGQFPRQPGDEICQACERAIRELEKRLEGKV